MADLIVNHVSAKSVQFQDFLKKGKASEYAELFLSFDAVFPSGASQHDLLEIYRPRPGFPFTKFHLEHGGKHLAWTTFTANQIDINVLGKAGQAYLHAILDTFSAAGISMIRLDAAATPSRRRAPRVS